MALLEKAAGRSDLTLDERSLLDHTLNEQRQLLSLYRTRQALIDSRPEARRLALKLALNRRFPWPARLKAALAVVLPGFAGTRLAERDRQSRELAGGIRL